MSEEKLKEKFMEQLASIHTQIGGSITSMENHLFDLEEEDMDNVIEYSLKARIKKQVKK